MSDIRLCRQCGYDLHENTTGVCPECGVVFEPENPSTYRVREIRMSRVNVGLGLMFIVTLVWAGIMLAGDWLIFFDIPSAILVLGLLFGGMWVCCGPVQPLRVLWQSLTGKVCESRDELAERLLVLQEMHRMAWGAGVLSFILAIIAMLADLSDPMKFGAALAASIIGLLYGAFLAEMIFAPLMVATSNRANVAPADAAKLQPRGRSAPRSLAMILFLCVLLAFTIMLHVANNQFVTDVDHLRSQIEQANERIEFLIESVHTKDQD